MRKQLLIILFLFSISSFCQNSSKDIIKEILNFQSDLNKQFKDSMESPLDSADLLKFTSHQFFKINLKYRIEAQFEKAKLDTFKMSVSNNKSKRDFVRYAYATFIFEGKAYKLTLFQSVKHMNDPKYADDLFLPFSDLTNGFDSYGGGRYLDLKKPKNNSIIIDFNQAYNPYCAYNHKYSCVIPPKENFIPLQIKAGIKAPQF